MYLNFQWYALRLAALIGEYHPYNVAKVIKKVRQSKVY
jgi:hypothetical protein